MTATLRNSLLALAPIVLTIFGSNVFAQSLNLNIGPSFASGTFASIDPTDAKAAYAGAGFSMSAGFSSGHGQRSMSLITQVFYTQNESQTGEMEKQFNSMEGPTLSASLHYPPGTHYDFSGLHGWSSAGFLAGLCVYVPTWSGITGFGRALAGLHSITSSSYSIAASSFFLRQESKEATSLMYSLGAGLLIGNDQKVRFRLCADYVGSDLDFGSFTFANASGAKANSGKMEIDYRVWNITAGIEINLHKPSGTGK
jgi:hypothetical protein